MPAYGAYNAKITINGTTLRATSVTVNEKIDLLETTALDQDTLVGIPITAVGIGCYVFGVSDTDVSVDAHWFSEDNPFQGPLNITVGTILSNVIITNTRALAGSVWTFPVMLVESVDSTIQVRDTVRYSFRMRRTNKPTSTRPNVT